MHLQDLSRLLVPGPVALIRVKRELFLDETITHLRGMGFKNVVLCSKTGHALSRADCLELSFEAEVILSDSGHDLINEMIPYLQNRWVYFGEAGDFLFFPHCATRKVVDLIAFMEEERRNSIFGVMVDLYPSRGVTKLSTIKLENTSFDATGYFRENIAAAPEYADRLFNVFGGLRARYSEHLPSTLHHANQAVFFKAHKDLQLQEGMRFSDPEFNTISCPWHHNVTFAVASYGIAAHLIENKDHNGSIDFTWHRSTQFDWSAEQFLQMGVMEPGQWF